MVRSHSKLRIPAVHHTPTTHFHPKPSPLPPNQLRTNGFLPFFRRRSDVDIFEDVGISAGNGDHFAVRAERHVIDAVSLWVEG